MLFQSVTSQKHHARIQKKNTHTLKETVCDKLLRVILSIIAPIFNYIYKANELFIKPRTYKRWKQEAVFHFPFSVCMSWCNDHLEGKRSKTTHDFISA